MTFDSYEYQIGAHFLSALINGDFSGLDDAETRTFIAWADTVHTSAPGIGHWATLDDSADEFGLCEITGLRGATEKVAYMLPVT